MRCRRCSHHLSPGADRCLRCFALNPQNVAGPLFAGLDSDPPKDLKVRFDDEPAPNERIALLEKTPAPPPAPKRRELAPAAAVSARVPSGPPDEPAPTTGRRFAWQTLALAWAVDFVLVGVLTFLHAALAVAVIGPDRLAPGPAGSFDYWLDLFRGGGLVLLWILLAATLALAYAAFSALLLGQTPGLALAREWRLPPERSAP
jgi:hypothetical protein